MKKTLGQVLIEQAEQMEKSAEAIRLVVAKSKEAGIEWPETGYKMYPVGSRLIVEREYESVQHHLDVGSIIVVDKIDDDFYFTKSCSSIEFPINRFVHESCVRLASFNDVE